MGSQLNVQANNRIDQHLEAIDSLALNAPDASLRRISAVGNLDFCLARRHQNVEETSHGARR